ncbi:MAG TPA: glycoside hydrolase family 27 protein [Blastocatellia bacterium]|nr:glycoside hydrolase family 27 protein [Blastocatellia bacterium]
MRSLILLLTILACSSMTFPQKFDKLAMSPPMGWNSWNKFGCDVNEKLIRETADAMVSTGMKESGYQYVVIDDCWHGKRDELGFIQPDPSRFPSGMKALADYVHSRGLKLGLYSDAGDKTCGGRPGSRGHEYQDALTYAKWGIDYLKYDWCNTDDLKAQGAYATMRDALRAAGRPIVFSLCEWGNNQPWDWAKNVGHLWRTTGDIYPCFDCEKNHGTWSQWGVMRILDMQKNLRVHAGPDHWNDPDMLEVGNGMSINEDRAHFSMWCMLAAPLIAGNDLRNMSRETLGVLTNKDVIAINQDPLGIQGFKYETRGRVEIWFKPLREANWAVCLLNRGDSPHEIEFDWKKQPVVDDLSKLELNANHARYTIRDLWSQTPAGTTDSLLRASVPAHDVIMLLLTR